MTDMQGIVQNIVISRDKSIYVPEIIKKSIVQRDHNVDRLTFDCPRYWNGIDISKLNIYVNYIAAGQKKQGEEPESFLCENVVADEDNPDMFHFDWRITSNVSKFQDKLIFIVCAKSVDAEGNEELHWNSRLCTDLEVQEGLEGHDAIIEKYSDVIEQILSKMGKQIELRNSGKAIQYRNAGENLWVDLVQLEDIKGDAAVIIESNFKGSDTTENILKKTGETGDKWYSTDEGVYYMINSFGDWINCGSGENLKKIEDEISKLKGDISQLSEEIGKHTGTGLSTEAIDKLEEVGNYLAYTTADGGSKWTELINILRNGSSGSGSGETEVTLSSISATYTGGNVSVGTSLTALTGITVIGTYSDGSTSEITGYALSGEIAEGSNIITVSYSGKTTTFTVTGVTESSGGEDEIVIERPSEELPSGYTELLLDGTQDISIPVFSSNPSGENGATYVEYKITDISSFTGFSYENVIAPAGWTVVNTMNAGSISCFGKYNIVSTSYWQDNRYLQFGLPTENAGTTVETIKTYLSKHNLVFYIKE